MYTFFVLDYDGTYDHVDDQEPNGVEPSVYLVPEEYVEKAKAIALLAHDLFHNDENDSDNTIQDFFDQTLKNEGINALFVGPISLPFISRREDYLSGNTVTVVI